MHLPIAKGASRTFELLFFAARGIILQQDDSGTDRPLPVADSHVAEELQSLVVCAEAESRFQLPGRSCDPQLLGGGLETKLPNLCFSQTVGAGQQQPMLSDKPGMVQRARPP